MGRPRIIPDDKLDEILERIQEGESQASIARSLEVSTGCLSEYLSRTPEVSERSAYARQMSAEAWLDKGTQAIEAALLKSSPYDVQAARAYAQECARRAAIRNPQYRDHSKVELSGSTTKADQLSVEELQAIIAAKDTPQA